MQDETTCGEGGQGGRGPASGAADVSVSTAFLKRAPVDLKMRRLRTLAASDYALIDDTTWRPRPSYWAALLWRRLMGETVLDAGPPQPGLHIYAQCLRGRPGGVALAAINLDRTSVATLDLPTAGERYTLSADVLESGDVKLNGRRLALTSQDERPPLRPSRTAKGRLALAPASITFLALPGADNPACR